MHSSFTRKLNRWGFSRVARGPETGAYFHKLFRRDKPDMCLQMTSNSGNKYTSTPNLQNQLLPAIPGMMAAPGMHGGAMPGMFPYMMPPMMVNLTPQQHQAMWQQQMQLQQMQMMQMQHHQMQQAGQQADSSSNGGNVEAPKLDDQVVDSTPATGTLDLISPSDIGSEVPASPILEMPQQQEMV